MFAINDFYVYQNLLWLVSSVYILFFSGNSCCSPLMISIYIKICYGSFHLVNIKRIKDEFFENKKVIFV